MMFNKEGLQRYVNSPLISVVELFTDHDCNPDEGDYSAKFSFSGFIDKEVFDAAETAIIDGFDFKSMKPEVTYTVTMKLVEEFEDYFINKHFEITDTIETPFN